MSRSRKQLTSSSRKPSPIIGSIRRMISTYRRISSLSLRPPFFAPRPSGVSRETPLGPGAKKDGCFRRLQLTQLLRMASTDQLFQFDGQLHEQREGVAMGSPLSPLLANVFMRHLEEELSDNDLIPSFYKRYVDDTLAIMPGVDAAKNFLDVLNGLHPSIHFTMELSNNDSIPFIGTLITKNGNKVETQVYRKPTNTGLLLHFQSHTDLRYKRCLIKTMVHRAKELSSTHQAFVDEGGNLKSMFHRLGYPSSLVNCIIDNCDYSSTLDA